MALNISAVAKNCLPRAVSNWLPLLYRAGDIIKYKGTKQIDLPRFPNNVERADSRFSVEPDTTLTCIGWSFGYYDKDGDFQHSCNPLHEIYYVFEGVLIDNETYEPHDDNGPKLLPLIKPEEDDPIGNICQKELDLPPEADYRNELDYPDNGDIQHREQIFDILSHRNPRPTQPPDFLAEEYTGLHEDTNGNAQMANAIVYIAESILMDRIYKTHGKPGSSWELVKEKTASLKTFIGIAA